MDAITGVLSTIGNYIKANPATAAKLGLLGAGEAGNFLNGRQRQSIFNRISSITPQQEAATIASMTQPLSAGLRTGVGNQVSAYMAERGLSEAPGLQAEALSEALAPYYQQNEQVASNDYMNLLREYLAAGEELPQRQNLSPLWANLLASLGSHGSAAGPSGIAADPIPFFPQNPGGTGGFGVDS